MRPLSCFALWVRACNLPLNIRRFGAGCCAASFGGYRAQKLRPCEGPLLRISQTSMGMSAWHKVVLYVPCGQAGIYSYLYGGRLANYGCSFHVAWQTMAGCFLDKGIAVLHIRQTRVSRAPKGTRYSGRVWFFFTSPVLLGWSLLRPRCATGTSSATGGSGSGAVCF